jgi:hypothetical protein
MTESVDVEDLKSSAARRAGSSPARGTILKHIDCGLSTGRNPSKPLIRANGIQVRVLCSVFQYGLDHKPLR